MMRVPSVAAGSAVGVGVAEGDGAFEAGGLAAVGGSAFAAAGAGAAGAGAGVSTGAAGGLRAITYIAATAPRTTTPPPKITTNRFMPPTTYNTSGWTQVPTPAIIASDVTPMNILWWHWLVLGLVLVVSELATPGGFYIVFFGIGALVVGVLAGFDMAGPVWTQLLLFSLISIMSIVLFRGRLLRMFQAETQAPSPDQLVGEVAVAAEDLAPGAMGRVELRGAAWSAKNDATAFVARGVRCRVTRVEGLTLHIVPEGAV